MNPQLVAAHKAYLKACKESNKAKFHESYTKYTTTNKEKNISKITKNTTINVIRK